ncbi:MAG: methyltransferase domain-containing protein [Myxococcales bacterium]|nr:methyltransferase domain-containing protein [Myxococcales bacterium]
MSQESSANCPSCGSESYAVFAELPDMPVHVGVLWESSDAARASKRGDVALAFCGSCGFVGNRAFDPSRVDYSLRYDNALHFSPTFRDYERDTAERLVERYDIRGRRVAEIGCGSGHFLSLICELGANRGIGFDPSYEPGAEKLGTGVRILREYYAEDHAEHEADLVCCRHVLEHIPTPRDFLDMVRRSLESNRDAVVYFEVPNAYLVFRDLSIWDVIYEHCNYFAAPTLDALFRASGFEVVASQESYEGQFLSIEARLAPEYESARASRVDLDSGSLGEIADLVARFADHVQQKREEWSDRLESFAQAGSKSVIWGAGAKTVSFLNLVSAGDTIAWVVDINPSKQGSFIAGTGQPIVAPDQLVKIAPDVVVVMNPVYREEIEVQLERMGLRPEVVVA